jgi:hypothetical protein
MHEQHDRKRSMALCKNGKIIGRRISASGKNGPRTSPTADITGTSGMSVKCHKRTHAPQYRLGVLQIEFAAMDRSSQQASSPLRFAAPVISTASARRRWLP